MDVMFAFFQSSGARVAMTFWRWYKLAFQWHSSVETEAEKTLNTLVFSMSLVTSCPVSSRPTFFLHFLLLPVYLQKSSLSFTFLSSFNSSWALAFLTPFLYSQEMFLHSTSVLCPLFCIFLFCVRAWPGAACSAKVALCHTYLTLHWNGLFLCSEEALF